MEISEKIKNLWKVRTRRDGVPQYMVLNQQDLDETFGENFSQCFNVRKRSISGTLEAVFEEEGHLYFCIIRSGSQKGEFYMRYNSHGLVKKIDEHVIAVYKENKAYCEERLKESETKPEDRELYKSEVAGLHEILQHPLVRLRGLFKQ